jgi:hypothetical protein
MTVLALYGLHTKQMQVVAGRTHIRGGCERQQMR